MPINRLPVAVTAALLAVLAGMLLAQAPNATTGGGDAPVPREPDPVRLRTNATADRGGPCMITAPLDGSMVQARDPIEIGWSRHDQPTWYLVRIYEEAGGSPGQEIGILHVGETATTHTIPLAAIRPNPYRFSVLAMATQIPCLDEDDIFGSWVVTPNGFDIATPTPTPAGPEPTPAIRLDNGNGGTNYIVSQIRLDGTYEEFWSLTVLNDGGAPLILYDFRPVLDYPFLGIYPLNFTPCMVIGPGESLTLQFGAYVDAAFIAEAKISGGVYQLELLSNDPDPPTGSTILSGNQVKIDFGFSFSDASPNNPPPDPTPYGPFPYCAAPSNIKNKAYLELN